MPNSCYNILKFTYHEDKGEKMEEVKNYLKSKYGLIDFNKITKQPRGIKDKRRYVLSNAEKDWNIENWGTKWNAYEIKEIFEGEWKYGIRFTTAWGYPEPIIKKLIAKFSDCNIDYIAADDGGWFAVHIQHNSDTGDAEITYCTENNNDPNGIIRDMVLSALNPNY